ncbi:alpha-mannosidase [Plakobranchus ocellatus]|uniref:Alpha-mannosidase n=1 Tax=Plakobranchus ocellatus TaxID=259542 RepID=A0AAV3Y7V4_9GAST|nr:alpha-mannosidase [Plakobranchus ocellatus]
MALQHIVQIILLQCIVGIFCFPSTGKDATCGYESCNKGKPGMINVHLIPHTHDDVGWIITVDQYFYKQVQWILDGVVAELKADPTKRFIYVEQAFFTRWYNEQDQETQNDVKKLVNEGRLEFILGGWSMNDEAATHYSAIIDNHKLGFEFLRQTFGECGRPRIGWQIDPFGHSREQASIFAQFGFDGLFFGRLDYQDKEQRMKNKTMEFVWEASPDNLGPSADLMTCVLFNLYMPPGNYWWDVRHISHGGNPDFFRDDKKLHDYNVDQMVKGFIEEVSKQANSYKTNHLIMTMGSDFNYVQAHMFFKEMDKLIKYVNAKQSEGSKVNLLYSTPSCYIKELNNDNIVWSTKQDDFFPYADRAHTFWTGYFTSRPALKFFSRSINSLSQAAKQMAAFAGAADNSTVQRALHHLAAVVGVSEHHDAITGTSKQAVAYDYAQRLSEGVTSGQVVIDNFYSVLQPKTETPPPAQIYCGLLNISICSVTESAEKFQVTLYNPLAKQVNYITRVPVANSKYSVYAPNGKTVIPSDIFPITAETKRLRGPRSKSVKNELVFDAVVPPLGFATYFVVPSSKFGFSAKEVQPSKNTVIQGKYISVTFDKNGHLASMTNTLTDATVPLQQNFLFYPAHGGKCTGNSTEQPSGAYIFRPADNSVRELKLTKWEGVYKGSLVQEARQIFGDWTSQVIRVYYDRPYVEVEWTVGPIPFSDQIGKEVVTRYSIPGFGNKGVFYTDSNGREILERRLNYRPTWKLEQTESVAGNYFPINALIAIKDGKSDLQFTVLTDRSHGGSSLNDGDVEIMLHRRLLYDDCKGVGEALNETDLVVRGKHYLLLNKVSQAARQYRPLAKEIFLKPLLTFSDSQLSPSDYIAKFSSNWTGMYRNLPDNVHILTVEAVPGTPVVPSPPDTTPFLIRFEHFYEVGEDAALSKPVTFDLESVLYPYKIVGVHELALGGNILASDVQRLKWKTKNNKSGEQNLAQHLEGNVVTLGPMAIVTLQVDILTNCVYWSRFYF